MGVFESGAVLCLRDGDPAVLRCPGATCYGCETRKRRAEEGTGSGRRVWSLAKRVRREGEEEASVRGKLVEAVVRSRGGEHRNEAEVESRESLPGGEPWRFMYYERGDWVEYPEGASMVAWERYRSGEKTAEVAVDGRVYMLSFTDMTQVNVATGYVRSIAWIGDGREVSLPASPVAGPAGGRELRNANRHRAAGWRDGATDSISSFILSPDGAQSCEDYELTKLTLGNLGGCKADARLEVEEKPTASSNFSSTLGHRFVKLDESALEFDDVRRKFLSGFGKLGDGTTITGIHRDSSPVAMARQEAFERQRVLTEQARGNANVKYGWHGTSKKGVAGIFLHGFGQPKTPKNGSAYGVGVYLAVENQAFVSAVYADHDENGEQHVVLCQVVAGATELVKPPSEQFHPSSEHYDTGVDDLVAPKRLIIWSTHMNTHVLPLYVVSFKLPPRWHRMLAELTGKQKIFCPDASVKHPFFMKQACGMAEVLRHKMWGMAEAMRNRPIGCANLHQGPTSAFIRFPQLFALLEPRLSPEQRLAMTNCYTKFEAGSMSRRTLVQEIQKLVGRDCLIHAIEMCQGFQGSQGTSVIKAQ